MWRMASWKFIPEDAHEEVNGVAGQIPLRPAPIGVSGMSGQFKVARLSFDEWEAVPLVVAQTGAVELIENETVPAFRGQVRSSAG